MNQHDWNGKKIAVLGLGVEGLSSAKFLIRYGADVTILDQKDKKVIGNKVTSNLEKEGIHYVLGKNYLQNLDTYELIVRSPGVKRSLPQLEQAEKRGVVITSQMQLFFDMCPAPIIGVTGTKGKGTTATLIYEMLKAEGLDVYVGGNIGTAPFEFLEKLEPHSWVVLELSSFQLQDLTKSPHISVMLMTTSEHLDYHANVYEYIDAKRNIFRTQKTTDYAVINKDYPASRESDIDTEGHIYWVSREVSVEQGCFIEHGKVVISMARGPVTSFLPLSAPSRSSVRAVGTPSTDATPRFTKEELIPTKDIKLPGEHNWENVCAAVMAARLAGASKKSIIKVLKEFQGLEHRLELVGEVGGVKYYDDSFSTTPETTIAAIKAFKEPEILILGGSSKNSDFSELGRVISERKNIKAIIGIGVEWSRIKEAIEYSSSDPPDGGESRSSNSSRPRQTRLRTINEERMFVEGAKDMHQIIQAASKIAQPGDVVLLSPACASFDMFRNYKERGEKFKEEARSLIMM